MKTKPEALRELLIKSVYSRRYAALLFSGGLDTAVLAAINPKIVAITVSLGDYAQDLSYSTLGAKALKLRQVIRKVNIDEALEAVPEVIRILRSFDPAIPNDLAVYFALKQARELGMKTIATGDASDELFGGYSFMLRMDDLESYIRRVAKTMKYSSNDIAKFFGLKIVQPFTDKSVVDFALRLPRQMKIRKTNGQLWGKWIVRKAFEDLLPKKLVWQSKRPLEFGSGMNRLRKIISNRISDEEFKRQAYPVRFLNKEHLYYYKIYCQVIGKIPQAASGQTRCPGCGGAMNKSSFHCKICGYVKDWRKV